MGWDGNSGTINYKKIKGVRILNDRVNYGGGGIVDSCPRKKQNKNKYLNITPPTYEYISGQWTYSFYAISLDGQMPLKPERREIDNLL